MATFFDWERTGSKSDRDREIRAESLGPGLKARRSSGRFRWRPEKKGGRSPEQEEVVLTIRDASGVGIFEWSS
jgi:hypothetical protein